MAPIAERTILAEPAAAQLDLTGNLGHRGHYRVAGVVQDQHRTLDDDGAGGLEGKGDGGGGDGVVGHAGNIDCWVLDGWTARNCLSPAVRPFSRPYNDRSTSYETPALR